MTHLTYFNWFLPWNLLSQFNPNLSVMSHFYWMGKGWRLLIKDVLLKLPNQNWSQPKDFYFFFTLSITKPSAAAALLLSMCLSQQNTIIYYSVFHSKIVYAVDRWQATHVTWQVISKRKKCIFCYWWYYPHVLKDSVCSVCMVFTNCDQS